MIVRRIRRQAQRMLQRDKVMAAALALAVLSSLINLPRLEYINFQVLSLLFCLMLVVTGFKKLRVLDYLAVALLQKCATYQAAGFALLALTFVSSMLVTNDVALLTFVPLTLTVARALNINAAKLVIWQTLAANLGSALTPMGNPQNLFLYAHYGIEPSAFVQIMLPLALFSAVWLVALLLSQSNYELRLKLPEVQVERGLKLYCFAFLFLLNILTVLRLVDYKLALLLTCVVVWKLSPRLFRYVDYSLLLTFIGFFIFIGNIANWQPVLWLKNSFLGSDLGVYVTAILVSQIISNVPAAMLLAGFTDAAEPLLLGVNVGGLGTLVASMASVISFKLYVANVKGENNYYLRQFTCYNVAGLAAIGVLVWLIYKI